jgi:hypothetical protein
VLYITFHDIHGWVERAQAVTASHRCSSLWYWQTL